MNNKQHEMCRIGFERLSPEMSSQLVSSMHSMISCDKSPLLDGLTIAEFSLILCVERHIFEGRNDITVAEAASKLNVSVPAISRVVKNLQSRGIIERRTDPDDRRSVRITVTPAGREVFAANKQRCVKAFDRVLGHFTDDELQTFAKLQSKFADNMAAELNRLKKSHQP